MSEGVAPLPPLHARHVRSLTRLLTAREDALVLCIAPVGEVRPRIEAALQGALGEGAEVCALDLPREGESAWTTMTARATEAREAGRRPVLSVSLRLDDVDEMARVNLGRESRQRDRLLVLLWLPGVEAYEEFRVRSPDVWSHRTELKFFLTRDDLAAVAEREGVPEVPVNYAEISLQADQAHSFAESVRLQRQLGGHVEGDAALLTAQAQVDAMRHAPISLRDIVTCEVERQWIAHTLRNRGSLAAIADANQRKRNYSPDTWPHTTNMIATALSEALVVQGRYGEAIEEIERSISSAAYANQAHANPFNILFDIADIALYETSLGRIAVASAWVDRLRERYEAVREQGPTGDVRDAQRPEIQAHVDWLRSRIDWLSGHGEASFLHAQRSLRTHVELKNSAHAGTIRSFRAELSVELGMMCRDDFRDRLGEIGELRGPLASHEWRLEPWPQDADGLRHLDASELSKTRAALRRVEKLGSPDIRAVIRDELCLSCLAQGGLDEARRLARAQVQDARSAQSPLRTARALVLLGRIEAARSLHHEALARYHDATAALEREPPPYRSLFAMRDIAIWRARSEHALGRTADALATLHTILAELNAQQLRLVTLDVLHELSVITLPDDPEAEHIAEEALSIAQDASALWFEARAMLDLAFVRRSRGAPAQPLITEAEAILDSYGDPVTLQRFRDRLPAA